MTTLVFEITQFKSQVADVRGGPTYPFSPYTSQSSSPLVDPTTSGLTHCCAAGLCSRGCSAKRFSREFLLKKLLRMHGMPSTPTPRLLYLEILFPIPNP